jgi:tetratricopeptide (TPR) repeat protein
VPLLVKLPQNAMAGRQISEPVRLLDIAPAILEAARIPVPSQMQGQSLVRAARAGAGAGQPAYSRSDFPQQAFGWSVLESWRSGKYLYIRAPEPELYDVSADPKEVHNLASSSPAILQTLAAQLKAFDDHLGNGTGKPADAGLTTSEVQKLASLGYVGLQKAASSADTGITGRDPKTSMAIANQTLRAMRMLADGKPAEAVPIFREIIAQQAKTYLPQYGLGKALAEQKQYSEAIGHLRDAIELQPDFAWPHYLMGFSLYKTGDFKTSTIHLEIASGRLPQFAALHALLAQVYERLARPQDAARERAKAAQLARN